MITKILKTLLFASIMISFTACGVLPTIQQPKSNDAMQTEIVQILTAMVTSTAIPEIRGTEQVETEASVTETAIEVNPTSENGQVATSTPLLNVDNPQPTEEATAAQGFLNTPAPLPTENIPPGTPEPALPTVSNTPITASTVYPEDPVSKLGPPSWKDTFDTANNWPMGIDKYVNLVATNGTMQMTGLLMQNGWRLSNQKVVNFYLEVTGKLVKCSGVDHYGLIFRVPNVTLANKGYLFGISCDGKSALRMWDTDKMTILRTWQADKAIKSGANEVNRIGVMVVGKDISMYVNGKLVGTFVDTSFKQGNFGLYIGPKETKDLTAIFDEISLWVLP